MSWLPFLQVLRINGLIAITISPSLRAKISRLLLQAVLAKGALGQEVRFAQGCFFSRRKEGDNEKRRFAALIFFLAKAQRDECLGDLEVS